MGSPEEAKELYDFLAQIEESAHSMRAALELCASSQRDQIDVASEEWDAARERLRDAYAELERIERRIGRESGG